MTDRCMQVYLLQDGVEAKMPAVPFTVTEVDFQGLINALWETEQPTYIEIKRIHRIASDHSSAVSFAFGLFELNVTKADFGKEEFSMECTFKGRVEEKYREVVNEDYTIEGTFSISDQYYLYAQVD